jgi:chaperonin GroES
MSKLVPREGSIILKQIETSETTVGNIIIPDMGDDRSLIAEVVAVSDVYNYHKGEFIPTDLKVGMKVTIPPMGAQKIKIDNVDYLIMAQNNIPAIIED